MNLKEAILYDYLGENKLEHYTNDEILEKMLKSGKMNVDFDGLKTVRPSLASGDRIDKFDPKQRVVSSHTVRQDDFGNISKYSNKEALARRGAGKNSIKIIIDGTKLKEGNIKNINIKAENEDANEIKRRITNTYVSSKEFIPELIGMIKKYHNSSKRFKMEEFKKIVPDSELKRIAKKYNLQHSGKAFGAFKEVYEYMTALKERTGTEKISFKSKNKKNKRIGSGKLKSSIPLDRKYMRIEFLKKPYFSNDAMKKSFLELITKNKRMFVDNDVLKELFSKDDPKKEVKKDAKKPFKKEKSPYHDDDSKEDTKRGFRVI